MRPVLFRWRGITIWSYPALLYVGLVFGILAGNRAAHAEGASASAVFEATFLLLVPALIGARLLFVAMHWSEYRGNLGLIWSRSDGGAAQYGALILILPLSIPVVALVGVSLGEFWDAATFTILVGMIFTRIGCLLNGCCSGRATGRWGLRLPNRAGVWERRIPTQLLEAAWGATLLVLVLGLWPFRPFPGAVFLAVTGGYGVGRLVLESMRERPRRAGTFTIHHAISLVLIVGSAAALAGRWPRS